MQAQRAGDIIRRIRGFVGKRDEARGDTRLPIIDINAAIRAAAGLVSNEALHHGTDLRLKLAPVLPPVNADTIQIQQVVVNLARNAMEAMDEADSPRRDLTIQTMATPDGGVDIQVLDSGPGIPEEIRARLFDPFFTTKAAGMGIGLSICRSIAEGHGGQISVTNRSRGGAAFRLTLPPARTEASAAV
jgi:signal transduction histidine kinase